MCGRVNVADNEGIRQLLESLGMDTWPTREPRYNIAPTQTLDVVVLHEEPTLAPMSWGVSISVPGKRGMVTKRVQNARNDKVWQSRLWKPMIEKQRVLVPINGFYEWKRDNKKRLSAFYISEKESPAMFLAGIFRNSADVDSHPEVSIVTSESSAPMSEIHHRIPVIFSSNNTAMAWLQEEDKGALTSLMDSVSSHHLQFTEVSDYVNKSSNEGPKCIQPLAA